MNYRNNEAYRDQTRQPPKILVGVAELRKLIEHVQRVDGETADIVADIEDRCDRAERSHNAR